jgi:signal transduction histidine kinase
MWLNFDASYRLDTAARDLLTALTDGLVIVMMKARAQAEREQERRLALSVLHSITDPLLVFDEKWGLLLTNPAAETVFGAQAVVGSSLRNVVQSDELVGFVEGGQPLNEWTSGEKTFVPRIQPVRDANDQPDGWILALRDITQFKKLNRNQNEFVRIVSHDLRSPLTSMQGFTSMLGMVGELNERQSQFIEKILSGIAQIAALVENIQDAGRFDIETGFYEMIRAQCDLSEMVSRIVDNHLVPAEKQELSVSVAVADDVPILNADANMLERALTNLVDNAIKYTPNGGKIDVKAYCKDNSVIISVRDTGLGISPDQQKQLFQRHVRLARQENKKIKGSGLGLFIVKSVAQRHGGDAWVESAENAGSTFYLSIPLAGANLVIPGES